MHLGLDLGGTNIACGVVDDNFKILAKASIPISEVIENPRSPESAEKITSAMYELSVKTLVQANLTFNDIPFWGIGMPSCVNPKTNRLIHANCFGWKNLPIYEYLQKQTAKKILIENDANCAAYGEILAGCGKNYSNAVMLTLGTGVGGGIIINKKIFAGANKTGAELGHTKLVHNGKLCTCGKKGCLEMYASATALSNMAEEALQENSISLMASLCDTRNQKVDGQIVFDAAAAGDSSANHIVNKYCDYLADGIASFISIFRPEVIILGGGISNAGKQLLDILRPKVYERTFASEEIGIPEILCAELKNDAGIIGAAFLE